jgi:hypothetical protein
VRSCTLHLAVELAGFERGSRVDLGRDQGRHIFRYLIGVGKIATQAEQDNGFTAMRMSFNIFEPLVLLPMPHYSSLRTSTTPRYKPTPVRQQIFHSVRPMAHGISSWVAMTNDRGVSRSTMERKWMPDFETARESCILIASTNTEGWGISADQFKGLSMQRVQRDRALNVPWRNNLPSQWDFFHPIAEVFDGTYTPFTMTPR